MRAPDPEIELDPEELRCPRCFTKDIVPSMPRGIFDRIIMKWGRVPRHCRACGKRFWVRADQASDKMTPR